MALRRRSLGQHHRPDWEQRLCRVDAALADDERSPAEAREQDRAVGREQLDLLTGEDDPGREHGGRPQPGEPSPAP